MMQNHEGPDDEFPDGYMDDFSGSFKSGDRVIVGPNDLGCPVGPAIILRPSVNGYWYLTNSCIGHESSFTATETVPPQVKSTDTIVSRLRATYASLPWPAEAPQNRAIRDAMTEIEHLRRWKAEAMEVLAGWDAVWREAGSPGELGQVRSVATCQEIRRLRREAGR